MDNTSKNPDSPPRSAPSGIATGAPFSPSSQGGGAAGGAVDGAKKAFISRPWLVAMFLFCAAGLNYGERPVLASIIPLLCSDLGVSEAQVSVLMTLFLWSYAIASLFAGNIADWFSRSRIIVVSLVLWSVVVISTGFVQTLALFVVLRILLGVFESMYLPAAGALLGDHHGPLTRARAMSVHMLGLNVGLLIGGASAGFLGQYFGWRFGFWLLGGMGLALVAVSPFFLREGPERERKRREMQAAKAAGAGEKKADAWRAYQYLLKVPSFYCMLMSAMAAGVASWIFLSWLPLYFFQEYKMSLGSSGLAGVALYKGPLFIGIAVGGWLSDRVIRKNMRGRALIKALAFLVSSPFLFMFVINPPFWAIAVVLVISSGVRAIGLPSEHPLLCEIAPSQFRSTAIGIFNTFGSLAGGAGVLVAGLLKESLGLNAIFGACAFIYVLAGLLMLVSYFFFIKKDMERARENEAYNVADGASA